LFSLRLNIHFLEKIPLPPAGNMDERAKIPVSLPSENPTQSYWQDPPDPIADLRTTEQLPSTADTVIIGSGITGAAVAWGLLQHSEPGPNPDGLGASIVMLEARQACSGATGRNGRYSFYLLYPVLLRIFRPKPDRNSLFLFCLKRRPYQSGLLPLLPGARFNPGRPRSRSNRAAGAVQHPRGARLRP
jgi:hypothetical protein